MKRNVDLLLYLPSIMKRYNEIQKIATTENPEFNLLWDADELIRQNLYIVTAQKEGLERYEKILGIYPSPDDSFETRRTRIIVRWNDLTPYTYRYLIGFLTLLTNGKFDVKTNFSEYEIELIISMGEGGAIDDLGYIIKEIIPCNLTVLSKNELDYTIVGDAIIQTALNYTKILLITNDFESEYTASGKNNIGSNAGVVSEILITNDFDNSISAIGSANSGSASVIITEYKI